MGGRRTRRVSVSFVVFVVVVCFMGAGSASATSMIAGPTRATFQSQLFSHFSGPHWSLLRIFLFFLVQLPPPLWLGTVFRLVASQSVQILLKVAPLVNLAQLTCHH